MSVFLTPDGAPFYGGTYFPDRPRHGMPSFSQVLEGVSQAWTTQRGEALAAGQRLVAALVEQNRTAAPGTGPAIDRGLFEAVDDALMSSFDARNGSWGGAPKFPQPMTLEYLLRRIAARRRADRRRSSASRSTRWPTAASATSSAAASTATRPTQRWLVPHFEQMLYDNAQLARVYLHAWAALGSERSTAIARSRPACSTT